MDLRTADTKFKFGPMGQRTGILLPPPFPLCPTEHRRLLQQRGGAND